MRRLFVIIGAEDKKKKTFVIRQRFFFSGADDEARTRYLHLGKVALYQMSYIRNCKRDYSKDFCTCQGGISNFFKLSYKNILQGYLFVIKKLL